MAAARTPQSRALAHLFSSEEMRSQLLRPRNRRCCPPATQNRESRDPEVAVPPVRARGPGCGPSYGSATVRASTPAEPLADGHFCWKEHVVLRLGRWRLSPWPPFCLRPSRQVLPGASGQWPVDLQSSTAPCTCPHVLAPPARKLSVSPRPFLFWDPAVLGTRHRRPDCPWPLQHRQAAGRTGLGTAVCVCVSLRLALPRPCVARPGPPRRAWGGLRDLIRLWGVGTVMWLQGVPFRWPGFYSLALCPSPLAQVCSQTFSPSHSSRAHCSCPRRGPAWRPR